MQYYYNKMHDKNQYKILILVSWQLTYIYLISVSLRSYYPMYINDLLLLDITTRELVAIRKAVRAALLKYADT